MYSACIYNFEYSSALLEDWPTCKQKNEYKDFVGKKGVEAAQFSHYLSQMLKGPSTQDWMAEHSLKYLSMSHPKIICVKNLATVSDLFGRMLKQECRSERGNFLYVTNPELHFPVLKIHEGQFPKKNTAFL